MSGSPLIGTTLPATAPLKGLMRREIGLEEAPFRLGVVGEGAALAVAEAGGLALVERDVLLGAQVEAEIVASSAA